VTVIGPVGVGVLVEDVVVVEADRDGVEDGAEEEDETGEEVETEVEMEEELEELEEAPIGTAWYTLSRFDPPQYSCSRISFIHHCSGKTNQCIALANKRTTIGRGYISTRGNSRSSAEGVSAVT